MGVTYLFNSNGLFLFWCVYVLISEAVPELHAVPLHKCSPASPPAQEPRPPAGWHHDGALQHGGCGFLSFLFFLLARVPQWLPRPRPPPTHNSCPKLHAREGEWTRLMSLIPEALITWEKCGVFTNVNRWNIFRLFWHCL